MKVSDLVIDFLAKKKIKDIFTVSGGGSIFLCDSLQRSKKINYVSCHHEQAAAFAAEGYARNNNSIAAAVLTTGPGGTNAVTGVASCWIDSIPLVFISGQVYLNQTIQNTNLRQLGVQEIDIVNIVKPITKYAKLIEDPYSINYELEKAFYIAQQGRPGPVWLDIPANIQNYDIELSNIKKKFRFKEVKKNKNTSLDKKIEKISKLLLKSKKPLFHFGHGIKLSKAIKNTNNFINKHNVPFSLTWNASDLVQSAHPLYCGRPGAFAERGSNFIVQNCDFFISIGSRLPFMITGYNSKDFARKAKTRIVVDIDENEINKKTLNFNYRIKSDADYFINKLSYYLKKYKFENKNLWIEYCNYIRKQYPILSHNQINVKKYVNSYFFIDKLSLILPNNNTVVTDMGLSFVGTHQAFKVKKGQKLFTNSGHAPMGWGLPAAVGACFSNFKKNTVCITGDGGLQMNIQELATIMHHQLPIKIFIYNNKGYLTIKQTQELGFKSRIMGSDKKSGLSFPNYSKVASSYKIKFVKISNHIKLENKLKKIINTKGPVICELVMDPNQEQKPKAINRRDENGKTIPTTFEDMHPFISKKKLIEGNYDYFISTKGKK